MSVVPKIRKNSLKQGTDSSFMELLEYIRNYLLLKRGYLFMYNRNSVYTVSQYHTCKMDKVIVELSVGFALDKTCILYFLCHLNISYLRVELFFVIIVH